MFGRTDEGDILPLLQSAVGHQLLVHLVAVFARRDADGVLQLYRGIAHNPREDGGEGGDKVVNGERDEARVVRDDRGVGDHLTVADAPQRRHHVPYFDAAPGTELPDSQLHEVERPSDKEEDDEVGNEEGAPSVLVSGVREPPHVPQAHGHGDAAEKKLDGIAPLLPLLPSIFLYYRCLIVIIRQRITHALLLD